MGGPAGKISLLPWSELEDGVLQSETYRIQSQLASINQQGYLTINSQPAVNGAPSSDPTVGWGGHNGCAVGRVACWTPAVAPLLECAPRRGVWAGELQWGLGPEGAGRRGMAWEKGCQRERGAALERFSEDCRYG